MDILKQANGLKENGILVIMAGTGHQSWHIANMNHSEHPTITFHHFDDFRRDTKHKSYDSRKKFELAIKRIQKKVDEVGTEWVRAI